MKNFMMLFLAFIVFLFGCTSDSKTLKLSPRSIDFENVNIGDPETRELKLTNKYGKQIVIDTLDLSGSSDFSFAGGETLPIVMTSNAEHTITIKFDPQTDGLKIGLLTIASNDFSRAKDVDIVGVGIAVPRIAISENSYDFQQKLINKSHTHDFEIENKGTAELSINNMSFSGSGMAAFKVTTTPFTIAAGTIKTVTITFEPTAITTYVADLSIVHTGVNENSTIVFPVEGEGIDLDPQITLSESKNWDVGSAATTLYGLYVLEIENTGIDKLTVADCTLNTSAEFTIDSQVNPSGTPTSFPIECDPGQKMYLYIKFSPSSTTTYNDTLSILHDGTNEPNPLDVSLSGSGRAEMSKTFTYTGSVDSWTVPNGVGFVRIEVWGAEGGENIAISNCAGKGARMRGDFIVTPGETLSIIVGQRGFNATSGNTANGAGGGGGGSFVWRTSSNTYPMIAAGAGGASSLTNDGSPHYLGKDGVTTEAGTGSRSHDQFSDSPGGTGGNDGKTITQSGGKGWVTIKNDPSGGTGAYYGGNGGYGGGGANGLAGGDPSFWNHNAGGGGGYSGGGAGGTRFYFGGGGGGSYNAGSNPDNTSGVQQGDGKIVITY